MTSGIGNHLIVDLFDISSDNFEYFLFQENFTKFDEIIEDSLKRNHMNLLNKTIHYFDSPQGAFTLLYLLSESHLSMHSWPEHGYLAVDIFTCGNCNTKNIIDDILDILKPGKYNITSLKRGIGLK